MKLLTKAIIATLPALYSTKNTPLKDKVVVCKLFCPWSNWTHYVIEGEPWDGTYIFFGFVVGFEAEFGNFTLKELEEVIGPLGLKYERDINWKPTRISEIPEILKHL